MVRQERARVTRQEILRGAAQAFEKFGYEGASLNDIIALAGVTRGALYFHFKSKEQIAAEIIDEQHKRLSAALADESGVRSGGLEWLIGMSFTTAHELMDESMIRAAMCLTLEGRGPGGAASGFYRSWIEVAEACIERAVADGDVRDVVPVPDLARMVVSTFTGVQLVSDVLAARADLVESVTTMWSLLLAGIVPPRKQSYFLRVVHTQAAQG